MFVNHKQFGLWTQPARFIQKHVPPGMLMFHEERREPFVCATAKDHFGILSNGEYTLCCLDTEGEMEVGNIKTMDPKSAVQSKRRADIITNAAVSKVCRRCWGKTFIVDTAPISDASLTVDKLGCGFFEKQLIFGREARWTNGEANAYFFTRLDASHLCVEFGSLFPSDTKFELILSRMVDPAQQSFATEMRHEFFGAKGQISRLVVPVQLRPAAFYRISLLSPSFVPDIVYHNGDQRHLGIAVASMTLLGQRVAEAAGPEM